MEATKATVVGNLEQSSNELALLFERFSEASQRLEDRYQKLLEETKVLRRDLEVKDLEVKRSQRLAALGHTAAAIAHEVRNPLGALELYVGLLKPKIAGQKSPEKILIKMSDCIKRLERVVQNILEFASERELIMTPVNIHALLQDELLQCVGSNQGAVRCESDLAGNPFILGHEQSLRQIFANLFSNARKVMSSGGVISVKTFDLNDQGLGIEIKDNGSGIAENIIERIFQPFVSGSESGTGLGLAIVKKLVEAHGGSIEASNLTDSSGAVFTIKFKRISCGKK